MPLEITLADITTRLRQSRYPNEQAVSQGIVLRLLQELGWDTWDTNVVWPEFQTGEGRADFALCHPASKPAVSIEVKQPGRANDAVRQSLEYAFHTGVPFVVLTDGVTWSFYLPAEQGTYDERRVYKLDLYERPSHEAASVLTRYLSRERVVSGDVLEEARREYRNRTRKSQARAAIPGVWAELVQKGDEPLVELLANAVGSKIGSRPEADDVAEFLVGLARSTAASHKPVRHSEPSIPEPQVRPQGAPLPESPRSGRLVLQGRTFRYANAMEATVTLLGELAKNDPQFLEKCSQHPNAQGRKRRYIARTAEELYPDRPDLRELRASLPGGWFIATNLNNVLKKTVIRLAADVAHLEFGTDVSVDF